MLNVVFAAHSGLWGVLVIDMVQFFIKMTAVIAAAYFRLKEVARHTGVGDSALAGLHQLVERARLAAGELAAGRSRCCRRSTARGQPILDILPNFAMSELALMIFIMPIAIGWWANWYPGAEPGGGSYIAQRMLASKSEKDSLGGTLFFNLAHYVLRPWPWIITALCSIIIFPELKDIQAAFPGADPTLIGHDSAFPGDAEVPAGGVRRVDGGRPHRGELVHDPDAPQLGLVVPGARLLPPLHQRRTPTEKHYVSVGPRLHGRCSTSWPRSSACRSSRRRRRSRC